MRKQAVVRIRFITGVILMLVLVLLVRLYQVQVLSGEQYKAEAESQYVHTVRDLFNRGSIYFTTKAGEKVSAATIQSGYLLAIDPSRIDDVEGTYYALASVIDTDREAFLIRANKNERTS